MRARHSPGRAHRRRNNLRHPFAHYYNNYPTMTTHIRNDNRVSHVIRQKLRGKGHHLNHDPRSSNKPATRAPHGRCPTRIRRSTKYRQRHSSAHRPSIMRPHKRHFRRTCQTNRKINHASASRRNHRLHALSRNSMRRLHNSKPTRHRTNRPFKRTSNQRHRRFNNASPRPRRRNRSSSGRSRSRNSTRRRPRYPNPLNLQAPNASRRHNSNSSRSRRRQINHPNNYNTRSRNPSPPNSKIRPTKDTSNNPTNRGYRNLDRNHPYTRTKPQPTTEQSSSHR